jgi:hypothetical protein
LYCAHIRFYSLYTDELGDSSTYSRRERVITIVSRNFAVPDDGPVRPEICSTLCVLKDCFVFFLTKHVHSVGLHCNKCIIMHGMENVNLTNLSLSERS